MSRIRKLIGEEISLSPIIVEDIPKIVEMANDFRVSDGIGYTDFVASYESMRDNIEGDVKRERPTFAIIKNGTDELMGYARILNTEYLHKTATVFIAIDYPYQDKHYGEEVLNLLLDYAFNYLDFYNIMLTVYSFNTKAIKCYEKVGFKKFGVRTKARYNNGKWYDIIYMEYLKDNFKGSYIKNKIDYD